ncbi:MAG: ABC transporter ATP-binding protein [Comamonas sp.]|nr:ABC transporter ATP-binding protein [Comamonas sp.]
MNSHTVATDFSTAAALELQQVRLQRGRTQVFDGLSLQLHEPRIGLIGDNGVGKTSLLRLLCGLEVPDSGQVLSQGQNLHAAGAQRARWVGMMFQNPDDQIIFPTVVEELALGLQPQGLKKKEAKAQALQFLHTRGLQDWADRAVTSLSQGQRQHVCWLALLLAGPRSLLLDEPYASLDLPGQARLARDIAQTAQQVIVSTHLLDHVRNFSRVIWLDQGRVLADGTGHSVCAAYEANVRARVAAMDS